MAWWSRRKGGGRKAAPGSVAPSKDDAKRARTHFTEFAATRRGVEAFVEPATHVTATTVILIAHDGEWTRRAVASREDAFRIATEMQLPTYDVNQTGYPQRMRDWNARQRGR
ncbi:hypothetical protein ACOCJ4_08965 [Knoellia sp. CPCC 206435]|jgi:hypothetical protein|uniref:hypothetical protein n=1 Tax=Knoellia terrae TaxID=3404797 RepID=UPI003B42ABF2